MPSRVLVPPNPAWAVVRVRPLVKDGDREGKCAPLALRGRDRDLTSVREDDLATDREPETGAVGSSALRSVRRPQPQVLRYP